MDIYEYKTNRISNKKSNTYATLVMVKWILTLNGKKATIWLAVYKIQLLWLQEFKVWGL